MYCKWNLLVDVSLNNTTSVSATLISSANINGAYDNFTYASGTSSNISSSEFIFNILNTSSDYIFGGNSFNFTRNNNILSETRNFIFDGYSVKRETIITK